MPFSSSCMHLAVKLFVDLYPKKGSPSAHAQAMLKRNVPWWYIPSLARPGTAPKAARPGCSGPHCHRRPGPTSPPALYWSYIRAMAASIVGGTPGSVPASAGCPDRPRRRRWRLLQVSHSSMSVPKDVTMFGVQEPDVHRSGLTGGDRYLHVVHCLTSIWSRVLDRISGLVGWAGRSWGSMSSRIWSMASSSSIAHVSRGDRVAFSCRVVIIVDPNGGSTGISSTVAKVTE